MDETQLERELRKWKTSVKEVARKKAQGGKRIKYTEERVKGIYRREAGEYSEMI